MGRYDEYESPLSGRYSSKEMKSLFSQRERATTWRKLWLWLAEAERDLGLTQISDEALEAMRENIVVTDEAFDYIAEDERKTRHDVMSHIHCFEHYAPGAKGVIHIGATSCYATDNGDLLLIKAGLNMLLPKLAKVIKNLSEFAAKYKALPTLSYTHYQTAIPMSMGKRACQWLQELMMDLENIEHVKTQLKFRGAQGTTGTQASFLDVFHGDGSKVDKLNEILCEKAGFQSCYEVSTQTYTRKVDLFISQALSSFGATASRIATDIRLLCHDLVCDEPRETTQIGSSAMAWKHNPARSERICSLGLKLSNMSADFSGIFANQWLERTLTDSACRRIDLPELFLLSDAILILLDNVTDGIIVFEATIRAQMEKELPFMATERIIMKLVHHGVSRQEAHERIRVHSFKAMDVVRNKGLKNDLFDRIKGDDFFKLVWPDLDTMLDPHQFIGRSVEIVDRYVGPGGTVAKKLNKYSKEITTATTAKLAV